MPDAPRLIRLRRADVCASCTEGVPAGAEAQWDPIAKQVTCLACGARHAQTATIDKGSAGASAQAEYERRRARREERVRERHPRTAGLRLALGSAPQNELAWAQGSRGEVKAARRLEKLLAG